MIQFEHWQLPDGETHLQQWMLQVSRRRDGRLTYQLHKYDAALQHCPKRYVAVDCGAHVGLWSYWMAKDFAEVHAFEPHPAHRECFAVNMQGAKNVHLYPVALGAEDGMVGLETGPSSSGDTYVVRGAVNGHVQTPLRRLDSFNLDVVNFLKIDCEGYEAFVVEGALETIKRCKPAIIVEQKPGHGLKYDIRDDAARQLLMANGYRLRQTISGDDILTFG